MQSDVISMQYTYTRYAPPVSSLIIPCRTFTLHSRQVQKVCFVLFLLILTKSSDGTKHYTQCSILHAPITHTHDSSYLIHYLLSSSYKFPYCTFSLSLMQYTCTSYAPPVSFVIVSLLKCLYPYP